MKLFLDSGNLDEIKKANSTGLLDGITTNPSLIAKEHIDFDELVKEILQIFKGTDKIINLEVINTVSEKMIEEGQRLAKISKNIVVKIPCTQEGLKACNILSKKGIRINITLCFSAAQALLAAKAGAYYISPFIGRLDDINQDGMELIKEIKTIYNNYGFKTQILVASIRLPRQVVDAALIGADIVTVPYNIFEKLIQHPLTDIGLEKFLDDWYKYKGQR